jgi:hypothetical protein
MKCSSLKHSGRETKILSLGDTRARISPMMWSPRLLFTGWAPKSLPSPRAHHWATPICHTSRNIQTCLHIIKSISKTWAIKAQQDWLVNEAINSLLLACKSWIGEALYYAKPALRVDPYFQVLALLNIFPLIAFINQLYSNHSTKSYQLNKSNKSCKQVIIVKHHQSIIKP